MNALPRDFYLRPALELAPALLGKRLVHETPEGRTAGIIVETEAYVGPEDDGAHSRGGKPTARTAVQFGPGGRAYVFGIYGLHWCFNAVANAPGKPEAVLVRALEPAEGLALMAQRRGTGRPEALCSGPGKLCQALGITRDQYGLDLCQGPLRIEPGEDLPPERVLVSPRVNIDYAVHYRDRLWRFMIKDSPWVSRVPARFAPAGTLAEARGTSEQAGRGSG